MGSRIKVTPGQSYGGKFLLRHLNLSSRRWRDGLVLFQTGKVITITYNEKSEHLRCFEAAAQVLGTFDSRVSSHTPVWEVKVMVDPLERATLQAAWNELIAHRAASHGNIAIMNFLIRFHQYHHHPWLPRSLATILRCSCSCPDFAGQRAFGNAPRRFDDPCKHVASVLWHMVDTADKDPTLIFAMRGFDFNHAPGAASMHPPGVVPNPPPPAPRPAAVNVGSKRVISLLESDEPGESRESPICLD